MKKLISLIALALTFVACNEDPEVITVGREINIVAMNPTVRTQVGSEDNEKVALLWAPNETIGVFGDQTVNAQFTSSNTVAAEATTFVGSVAEEDNAFVAYYPFVEGATNMAALHFTLNSEQTQTADGPAIAENDLKYGVLEANGTNKYTCEFQQCFSLVKFTIDVTDSEVVKEMYLDNIWLQSEGAVLAGDFVLNVNDGTLTKGDAQSDGINLYFENRPALSEGVIEGWVVLNPELPAGSELNFVLTAVDAAEPTDNESYITATATLTTLKELQVGTAYNIPIKTKFLTFASLNVSPSEVNFEAEGGECEVSATSDFEITVENSASWLTVSGENGTYTFVAEANTASSVRTAEVTFSILVNDDETISKVVTVTQAAAEVVEFEVSESALTFAASPGNKYVKVTSLYSVSAVSDSDWCTVEDAGEGMYNIAVTSNTASSNRSATITFTETDSDGNTQQKTVSVTQTSPETITLTAAASSSATDESITTVRMLYTGGNINVAINGLPATPTVTEYGTSTGKKLCSYVANDDGTYTVTMGENNSQYHRVVLRFYASDDSSTTYSTYLFIEQNPWMYITAYNGLKDDNGCYHLYFPLSGGTRYLDCNSNQASKAATTKIYNATYGLMYTTEDFYNLQLSSEDAWVSFGERSLRHTPITVESSTTPRESVVTFTVSDGNTTLTEKTLYIHQIDVDKADKTANCYVVESAGTYSFNATVMGNGHKGLCNGEELDPTIDPKSVQILWQDTDGFISDVSLADGVVTYTASSNLGNAVIAVYDDDSNILWSWHIWGTGGALQDVTMGGYSFLPLNLGAKSSSDIGMLYQGMRKDPFPSDQTDFESCITLTTATTTNAKYPYTYAHPNEYLTTSTSATASGHWYNANTTVSGLSAFNAAKTLESCWGYMEGDVAKTINDPCPIGYRVPTKHDVLKMTTDDLQYLPAPITGANIRIANGALATSLSPNNGFLWTTYSYNGSYYNVMYSTSTLYPILYMNSSGTYQSTTYGAVCAMPVRCVKY